MANIAKTLLNRFSLPKASLFHPTNASSPARSLCLARFFSSSLQPSLSKSPLFTSLGNPIRTLLQNPFPRVVQTRGFCKMQKETRNVRDHKRRLLAERYELKRNLYKAMLRDPSLPADLREKMSFKLARVPRSSSFTRVRNRCIFSGRPRAVYRQFRMSRIVFRKLASEGQLMGIKKASW